MPVFALGGIDAESAIGCVLRHARLACIGAVLGRATPREVADGARALAEVLTANFCRAEARR